MTKDATLSITLHDSLSGIGQMAWDRCANPETVDGGRALDPFTTYRFLHALESSGSVGGNSGWLPRHVGVEADGQIIACVPAYVKLHSQGEYIFDHNWAHAYERAGGHYYPKLQVAVPFSPVTGRRLLVGPGISRASVSAAVLQGLQQVVEQSHLSGVHMTFCTQDEYDLGPETGFLQRVTHQYHWQNAGYADFDEFLAQLSSRKRKNIRKERSAALKFDGQIRQYTGDDIRPEHWDAFWLFYQDTGARKWGAPYLTREFFEIAHQDLRDDILLVFAEEGGKPIAGAMNMIGRDALYGRYWGCGKHIPQLHFEMCYYQAIDYALAHGLERVEAGAQGEHKLARGYVPVPTYSLHWVRDRGFGRALEDYLEAERKAVDQDIVVLTSFGPFKNTQTGNEND